MDSSLEQSRTLFFEGIGHFESGRFDPARACFERCLQLTPGRPSVLGNLGITLFHLRRWGEAVNLLQQTVAADPQHAEAWACLGLAHEARGDWQAAGPAFARAVELAPQPPRLWLALGQARLRAGDADAALGAYDQALALDPQCAPAWSERGTLMRELHRFDEARRCFEKALALGADPELHRYYLASLRGETLPAPPRRYVEALFDDYAPDFEGHLVDKLGYCGHRELLGALLDGSRRWQCVLDLGCGTGLCGALAAPHADALVGVDVSAAMLEQARARGVYGELIHADLGDFLDAAIHRADLVLAADVFIYVGALENVFRAVRRLLQPGGCFAFTVEEPAGGLEVQLQASLRYAHPEAYLRRLAETHGFAVRALVRAPIRYDRQQPIPGLYVYLE